MLCKDDVPNVEAGVQVTRAFAPGGPVVPSQLPARRVARALHRGSYDRRADTAELETEVYYLLA
jgi:hypothetical protein